MRILSGTGNRAATLEPAKLTGMERNLGTIQVGKLADLVLLDRDPLLDIANTKAIAAVLADGRYYDRAALDAMVQRVASSMDEETKKLARPVH
jgi:cytosine/adenosine deaminase-related metal-dependent hydrolase